MFDVIRHIFTIPLQNQRNSEKSVCVCVYLCDLQICHYDVIIKTYVIKKLSREYYQNVVGGKLEDITKFCN